LYRETLFKYPKLRQTYLFSVISALPNVSDSKSLRSLLWLVGEFCVENGNILAAIQAVNSGLGELPMLAVEEKYEAALRSSGGDVSMNDTNNNTSTKVSTKILADGTYASEFNNEDASSNARQLPNIKSKRLVYLLFSFSYLPP
jgi:coatomer subunit beta